MEMNERNKINEFLNNFNRKQKTNYQKLRKNMYIKSTYNCQKKTICKNNRNSLFLIFNTLIFLMN